MIYSDRYHAGRVLAADLVSYRDRNDVIVLALPRGGVLVGCEIATQLHVPLDVIAVRKIGLPEFPEMAIGAIAPDGVEIVSEEAISYFQIAPEDLQRVMKTEKAELQRRTDRFREGRPFPSLHGKTVILVDDGLATGQTMSAAIAWTREHGPKKLVVAVPVGAPDTCKMLKGCVDRLVCPSQPGDFHAVGSAYLDFRQVTDDEVVLALRKAREVASFSATETADAPEATTSHGMTGAIPLVKTARIKLSSPQAAEISLTDGRVVRLKGEAAREPINAITSARGSRHYHSTFGVPMEGGGVLVLAVDGSHLDAVFKK